MKNNIFTILILCFITKSFAQTDSSTYFPKIYVDASFGLLPTSRGDIPTDLTLAVGKRITDKKALGIVYKGFGSLSSSFRLRGIDQNFVIYHQKEAFSNYKLAIF